MNKDKVKRNWQRLPHDVCRAYEVAQAANFGFYLVDLTENNSFKNMIDKYKTTWQPKPRELNYIIDSKLHFNDMFNCSERESFNEAMKRVENCPPISKDSYAIKTKLLNDDAAKQLFKKAFTTFSMNFIQAENCLYLTDTIRALDNSNAIKSNHVAEAIQYCTNQIEE